MIDRVHHVALSLFLWLGVVLMLCCFIPPALVLWWAVVDRTPPISAAAARFGGWDPARPGVARVEWSAVRNRSCPGTAYRWLIGGGRIWDLPPETVPYAGSTETFGGDTSRWTVDVRVPPDALASGAPLAYRVHFEWACNPLQAWSPLAASVPDIPIPPPP